MINILNYYQFIGIVFQKSLNPNEIANFPLRKMVAGQPAKKSMVQQFSTGTSTEVVEIRASKSQEDQPTKTKKARESRSAAFPYLSIFQLFFQHKSGYLQYNRIGWIGDLIDQLSFLDAI